MMDSVLREKLTHLTTKCDTLSKSGKYVECIDIMEEIVSIKKNVYGIDHVEFEKATEKLCEYLNLAAMIYLQKQKFEMSLDYLRKAELVARNSLQYKSTTYNNLACYYRRTGKIRTALTYLIQALEMELKIDQPKTLPDTHLNLCAVLSQLDRHEDALQHVMLSIILLQDQFLQTALPNLQESETPINDQRLAVLAIAYHNLGVQFQHLKRYEEAVKIYKKALHISREHLSENDQLIQNLTRVVNSATEQIQDQKKVHLESKKKKVDRQLSETKKDIYKDLSKNIERNLNFPKFGIRQLKEVSSTGPVINHTSYDAHARYSRQRSKRKDIERGFVTRKQPRYYKSFAVTPDYEQSQGIGGGSVNKPSLGQAPFNIS